MRSAVILLFIFFYLENLSAQQLDSLRIDYDSLTLVNYLNADWGRLVSNSNLAIEKGFETVVIRKRLAYGLFQQENYLQSIKNYKVIYLQNKSDQDAILMLCKNYYQLGKAEDANYYLCDIPDASKKYWRLTKNHFIAGADLSSGISLNSNIADNENKDIRRGGVYGSQTLNGELYYLQAGLKFCPTNWLNVYFSFEDVQMKKAERISATNLKLTGTITDFYQGQKYQRNLYSYIDTTHRSNTFVNQRLGYVQVSIVKPDLFTFRIFGDYLMNQYSLASSKYRIENYIAQPVDTFYSERTIYSFADTLHTDYEYIFGAALEKVISTVQAGINATYSNLNSKKQILGRAEIYWFPKGNTRYVLGGSLTYLMEENSGRYIPEINSTFQISKKTWLTLLALLGDLSNTTEFNGLVVHNSTDKTVFRFSSILFRNLNSHFNINFTFHFTEKKNSFITYPQADRLIITEQNYNSYLLAIGIKYTL